MRHSNVLEQLAVAVAFATGVGVADGAGAGAAPPGPQLGRRIKPSSALSPQRPPPPPPGGGFPSTTPPSALEGIAEMLSADAAAAAEEVKGGRAVGGDRRGGGDPPAAAAAKEAAEMGTAIDDESSEGSDEIVSARGRGKGGQQKKQHELKRQRTRADVPGETETGEVGAAAAVTLYDGGKSVDDSADAPGKEEKRKEEPSLIKDGRDENEEEEEDASHSMVTAEGVEDPSLLVRGDGRGGRADVNLAEEAATNGPGGKNEGASLAPSTMTDDDIVNIVELARAAVLESLADVLLDLAPEHGQVSADAIQALGDAVAAAAAALPRSLARKTTATATEIDAAPSLHVDGRPRRRADVSSQPLGFGFAVDNEGRSLGEIDSGDEEGTEALGSDETSGRVMQGEGGVDMLGEQRTGWRDEAHGIIKATTGNGSTPSAAPSSACTLREGDESALGDSRCHEEYNAAECGWDGGDCCWQTCQDGVEYSCGGSDWVISYDCRDPEYTDYSEGGDSSSRMRERTALKRLFEATEGESWRQKGQWNNGNVDHCYWHDGVRCNGEGHVMRIRFSRNDLGGTLPTELGELVHLEGLVVHSGLLSGSIPTELGKLVNLTDLSLTSTSISGPVPTEISQLVRLQVLTLNDNSILGTVPTELGELVALTKLSLTDNSISGSLPTELGQLLELEGLYLSNNNNISSSIPASFANLLQLREFYVRGTSLSGAVPANLLSSVFGRPEYYEPSKLGPLLDPRNCANVENWKDANGHGCGWYANGTCSFPDGGNDNGNMGLTASTACCTCGHYSRFFRERKVLEMFYEATAGEQWNNNAGWMVDSVNHCMNGIRGQSWWGIRCNDDAFVSRIELSSNNLVCKWPSCDLPTDIGELTNLEKLHLGNNSLEARVPTEWASLSSLKEVDLSHNELHGDLNVLFFGLPLMEDLRLSSNLFHGRLPIHISNMTRLKWLHLDGNQLRGSIPTEIGLLRLLRELKLSKDYGFGLSGSIPAELGTLQYLQKVELAWNKITGELPTELGWLARLESLVFSGNHLSGRIPSQYGDLQSLQRMDFSHNSLSYELPTELGFLTRLEGLFLNDNRFEGIVPSEYGLLPSVQSISVRNSGWTKSTLDQPAPLSLCFNEAFDLRLDASWCPPDRNALKRVYDATNGAGWTNSSNWAVENNHCTWHGVSCSEDGTTVVNISLSGNELSGVLPSEMGLSSLEYLNLDDNRLVGRVPSELFSLNMLRGVNLTGNSLSGTFPQAIAMSSSLKEVFISNNRFSSGGDLSIPRSNESKLARLHMSSNKFQGDISNILDQLHNLPMLEDVDLSENAFSGVLSASALTRRTKLAGNKELAAPIPSSICHDPNIHLDLQKSSLHCPVLPFLKDLYDSTNGAGWTNKWNWNESSTICDATLWYGITCDKANTSIVDINLTENGLSGTLPSTFGHHLATLEFLQVLDLSWNNLQGSIPLDLARLSVVEDILLSGNNLSGTILAQLSSLARLKRLALDRNSFTGTLPVEFRRLGSLRELRLSSIHAEGLDSNTSSGIGLRGAIPAAWGDLANLEHLDISNNRLTGVIPKELAKLGRLVSLQLSNNRLTGVIPKELATLAQVENVALTGNKELLRPAPLSVCALSNRIDLNSSFCPKERSILKSLYEATNGLSWANSTNWINEYILPCDSEGKWFGVSCNNDNVVGIDLRGNSVYGTLPSEVFQLKHLRELKLGDNRLFGTLPSSISHHNALSVLQLAGNDFSGDIPEYFTSFTNLSLLHLHANKFVKGVPSTLQVTNMTGDCVEPYYYGDFECESCSICCNSEGACRDNASKQEWTLQKRTALFLGGLVAFLILFGAMLAVAKKRINHLVPRRSAMEYCGTGSLYNFFLTDNRMKWFLASASVAAQFFIIMLYFRAADVTRSDSDFVNTLRCPSNQLECDDDRTVDYKGWLVFGLVMLTYLGRDIISGMVLVYMAVIHGKARYLFCGILLEVITGFTLWTSVQYNVAISTTNTELITEAVIILFVTQIDEELFTLIEFLFPEWVVGAIDTGTVENKIPDEQEATKVLPITTHDHSSVAVNAPMEVDDEKQSSSENSIGKNEMRGVQIDTMQELREIITQQGSQINALCNQLQQQQQEIIELSSRIA